MRLNPVKTKVLTLRCSPALDIAIATYTGTSSIRIPKLVTTTTRCSGLDSKREKRGNQSLDVCGIHLDLRIRSNAESEFSWDIKFGISADGGWQTQDDSEFEREMGGSDVMSDSGD